MAATIPIKNSSYRQTIVIAILLLTLLLLLFIGYSGWRNWRVQQSTQQVLLGSRIHTLAIQVTTSRVMERALTMAWLSTTPQADSEIKQKLLQARHASDHFRAEFIAAVQTWLRRNPDHFVLKLQLAQESEHNQELLQLRERLDASFNPQTQSTESAAIFELLTHIVYHTRLIHEATSALAAAQADKQSNLRAISGWAAQALELVGQSRSLLSYYVGTRQVIPPRVRQELNSLQREVEHYLEMLREVEPWLVNDAKVRGAIQGLNRTFPPALEQLREAVLAAEGNDNFPVDQETWLTVANRAVTGLTAVAQIGANILEAVAMSRQQQATWSMVWLLVLGLLAMALAGLAFQRVGLAALSLERQRNKAKRMVTKLSNEIARRRQLLQDLRRYQVMVSSSPDLFSLIEPDYTYRIINDTCQRLYGQSPKQIVGKRVADLLGEEIFRERVQPMLDQSLAGETVNYEDWFDLPGGDRRYMSATYFPFRDQDGKVVGVVVSTRDMTTLKITEETLRQRQKQLRIITDAIPGLVVQIDRKYRFRFVNRTGAAWLGQPVHSLIGKDKREVIGEGRFAKLQPKYEQAFGGNPTTFEKQMPCADGVKRWLQLTLVPKVEQSGQVESLYVLGTDITYRKNIESALLSSQASFRSIVEQNISGIAILDELGECLFCNPTIRIMLGISCKSTRCSFNSMDLRLTDNTELKIRRLDGSDGLAQVLLSDTEWQGKPASLVVLHDITQRKRIEAELWESRERLHQLLDSMYEGVYGVDKDDRCTFVNRSFLQMLGYEDASEVLGKCVHDLIHHSHADGTPYPASHCPTLQMSHSHLSINISDEVFWRKDGTSIPVEYRALPILVNTDVIGTIVTFIDITERKRSEDALRQLNDSLEQKVLERTKDLEHARSEADSANRAKSAFLATMSHEIRTPMNGVVGMVDVLEQSDLTAHQSELVGTIRDSANGLLRIIDDILDFSKIEAERMELEHEPVCLEELIEGLCDSLVPGAARKSVALRLFVSPDIPDWVLSDEVRLRQLFYNLIGNAIKFSAGQPGKRGQVSVRVEVAQREPLRIICSVADNGIGMSPETVKGLFTPFTQAEVSSTRKFGGTGLGLAICKRLVDLMTGEITVESTPGTGSVFSFTLPFEIAPEQPLREQPDIAGLECILVDSPELYADDLCVYLEHAGASVQKFNDVMTACQVVSNSTVPVIILASTHACAEVAQLEGVSSTPRLLITYNRQPCARVESEDIVTLGLDAMRRLSLLRAVAVSAGRASPEIVHTDIRELHVGDDTTPSSVAAARARNQLILVAEDDEINQKVILQQLAVLGYTAEIANDGAEALRMWREGHYAVLLTDLHMPEMDGYRLAESIRQEEADGQHMPIMALTANALRGEANRAYAVGMDEYITKPIKLPELRTILEKWLSLVPKDAAADTDTGFSEPRPDVPLDITVLQGLVGDDPDIIQEFLADYLSSAKNLVVEMRGALAAGDAQNVRAIAHKLKSSSRSVGALVLGDMCAELENTCGMGNISLIEPSVEAIEAELAEIEVEIKRVLVRDGLDAEETI